MTVKDKPLTSQAGRKQNGVSSKLDMVAHTFNASIWEEEEGDLREASLVYMEIPRPARATQWGEKRREEEEGRESRELGVPTASLLGSVESQSFQHPFLDA